MRRMIRSTLLAAVCLAAACGGSDDKSTASTTPPPATGGTQETIAPVDCAAATADASIEMRNLAFTPRETTIAVGGVVRFVNNDTVTHDITSGEPGHSDAGALFRSGNLTPGGAFCVRFPAARAVDFFCSIHPEMQGEIKVGN